MVTQFVCTFILNKLSSPGPGCRRCVEEAPCYPKRHWRCAMITRWYSQPCNTHLASAGVGCWVADAAECLANSQYKHQGISRGRRGWTNRLNMRTLTWELLVSSGNFRNGQWVSGQSPSWFHPDSFVGGWSRPIMAWNKNPLPLAESMMHVRMWGMHAAFMHI